RRLWPALYRRVALLSVDVALAHATHALSGNGVDGSVARLRNARHHVFLDGELATADALGRLRHCVCVCHCDFRRFGSARGGLAYRPDRLAPGPCRLHVRGARSRGAGHAGYPGNRTLAEVAYGAVSALSCQRLSSAHSSSDRVAKINTPVSASRARAANRVAISSRLPDSTMRQARPVAVPEPATNSATTAPISARPPAVFMPESR